jgi:hypothetical protein
MRHLLIFSFLLSGLVSNCQPPIPREWRNLKDRIDYALVKNDTSESEKRGAEYIFCMIKVDSLGKVASMNVLADPQNIGPIYKVINAIPLSVFNGWEYQKAMGHTIIIPFVYCPEEVCPEYINDLVNSRGDHSIFWRIFNETSTTIEFTAFRILRHKPSHY